MACFHPTPGRRGAAQLSTQAARAPPVYLSGSSCSQTHGARMDRDVGACAAAALSGAARTVPAWAPALPAPAQYREPGLPLAHRRPHALPARLRYRPRGVVCMTGGSVPDCGGAGPLLTLPLQRSGSRPKRALETAKGISMSLLLVLFKAGTCDRLNAMHRVGSASDLWEVAPAFRCWG
jgi:hypothetical protein